LTISKEQQTQMMAQELREEEIALEKAGRSVGIPRTSDLISVIGDLKAGKEIKPRQGRTQQQLKGSSSQQPSSTHSHHAENQQHTNNTINRDDIIGTKEQEEEQDSVFDLLDRNDDIHLFEAAEEKTQRTQKLPPAAVPKQTKQQQYPKKNKIGTTKKQNARLGLLKEKSPTKTKQQLAHSRFGKPESRGATASSRGTSRGGKSDIGSDVGFDHEKGAVPPQDVWDFDPSVEILDDFVP